MFKIGLYVIVYKYVLKMKVYQILILKFIELFALNVYEIFRNFLSGVNIFLCVHVFWVE